MKTELSALSRKAVVLALAAVVLAAGAAAYVASKHAWARDRLAELEPRYARLVGIEASASALDAALAERRGLLTRHAYLSSLDVARAGSDAQQRAREIFTKAGLEVASTQVLPAKAVDGYDRIPVVLRMDGDLAALQSALVVLPGQAPSLFMENFIVQTTGMPKPDAPQRLSLQVNLFVLRVRQ
jgi:general secretion pathway protein M